MACARYSIVFFSIVGFQQSFFFFFVVHPEVAALNFASARNPGGGFLGGALAQEESIAAASSLYSCQTEPEIYKNFYRFHETHLTPLYSNRLIFSPGVPVLRSSASELLPKPYLLTILTCAAVNAGYAKQKHLDPEQVSQEMEVRIRHVLAACALTHQSTLVLGAFGCGVFQNDARFVAECFVGLLSTEFKDVFQHITFAIPGGEKSPNFRAFRAQLSSSALTFRDSTLTQS